VLLTGDEETGGLATQPVVAREARRLGASGVCLTFEPGRCDPWGGVVVARAGAAAARVVVTGVAAHAGERFYDGTSAVDDLARKVIALTRLTDARRGQIVNAGVVETGHASRRDRVADECAADFDVRYRDDDDGRRLRALFFETCQRSLCKNPLTGAITATTLEWIDHCQPMPLTAQRERMYLELAGIADLLDMRLPAVAVGGGSDANTIAAEGALVMDGLGPVGGGFHSDEEWVDLTSIVERATLCALFLRRLWKRAGDVAGGEEKHG
jgi:glutamate carboxypeptidase